MSRPTQVLDRAPARSQDPTDTRPRRATVRRVLGVLCLVAGLVAGGALVHQLWWTDRQAAERTGTMVSELQADFARTTSPDVTSPDDASIVGTSTRGAGPTATPDPGPAVVHLPTLGEELPVLEGVGADVLDQGVLGRYPGSGAPGEVGNYAVAGHRTTYGRPLWALADLRVGDPVVVETAQAYHVYLVTGSRVTVPEDVGVLAPTPDAPGVAPTEASMVLTTCHPRFSQRERLIGYAVLDRSVPRTDGPPPELSAGGGRRGA